MRQLRASRKRLIYDGYTDAEITRMRLLRNVVARKTRGYSWPGYDCQGCRYKAQPLENIDIPKGYRLSRMQFMCVPDAPRSGKMVQQGRLCTEYAPA